MQNGGNKEKRGFLGAKKPTIWILVYTIWKHICIQSSTWGWSDPWWTSTSTGRCPGAGLTLQSRRKSQGILTFLFGNFFKRNTCRDFLLLSFPSKAYFRSPGSYLIISDMKLISQIGQTMYMYSHKPRKQFFFVKLEQLNNFFLVGFNLAQLFSHTPMFEVVSLRGCSKFLNKKLYLDLFRRLCWIRLRKLCTFTKYMGWNCGCRQIYGMTSILKGLSHEIETG